MHTKEFNVSGFSKATDEGHFDIIVECEVGKRIERSISDFELVRIGDIGRF